jgi:hypothetical protein
MIRFVLLVFTLLMGLQVAAQISARPVFRSMMPAHQYQWLNTEQRKTYLKEVQAHWIKFEETLTKKTPVAATTSWLSTAIAADGDTNCLIGGVSQPVIGGLCSSRNNECEGQSDSFKCGPGFHSVCIPRTPVRSISQRCGQESSKAEPLTAEQYADFAQKNEVLYQKHCSSEGPVTVACAHLKRGMENTQGKAAKTAEGNREAAQAVVQPADPKARKASAQGADVTQPPAPAAEAPTVVAKPGACIDTKADQPGCAEGSLGVIKNADFPACKKAGMPELLCNEYQIATCRNFRYEPDMTLESKMIYMKTNVAHAKEVLDQANLFAEAHNKVAEEEDKARTFKNLEEFYKAMEADKHIAVPAHTDAEGKAAMMHFAEVVNQQRKLCSQIALLNVRREEIKRCEMQTKRAPDVGKTLNLKELNELGSKFKNDVSGYAKSCEQGKEFFGPAVRMQVGCKTPRQDCQMVPFTGYPISVDLSSDGKKAKIFFVNGNGKVIEFPVETTSSGGAAVRMPGEKNPVPLILQQGAPCEVMRQADTPEKIKKYTECFPITEYLKQQQASSAKPGSPAAPKAPGAK